MSAMPNSCICNMCKSNKISLVLTYMVSQRKQATIHQIYTMLATSKNVLFPGHNRLLTTGTDDPILRYRLSARDMFLSAVSVYSWCNLLMHDIWIFYCQWQMVLFMPMALHTIFCTNGVGV